MRHRRVALLLVGMWMGASLFVAFAVTRNLANVDDFLQTPPQGADPVIRAITPDNARMMLQHLVNEETGSYRENWEVAQVGLFTVLAGLLFLDSTTRKFASFPAGLCLLVLFEHFRVTPEIIWLSRQVAFAAQLAETGARKQLSVMERIYELVEISKFCIATILGVLLVTRGAVRRHRHRHHDLDSLGEHATRT